MPPHALLVRGDTLPATVPFRPVPSRTVITYGGTRSRPVTVINRTWPAAAAARCRLCARCTFTADAQGGSGSCEVVVLGRIEPASAALFSPLGPTA